MASGVLDGTFVSLNSIWQRSTGQTRRPEYVVVALVRRVRNNTQMFPSARVAAHQYDVQRIVLPIATGFSTGEVEMDPTVRQLESRTHSQENLRFVIPFEACRSTGNVVAREVQLITYIEQELLVDVRFDMVSQIGIQRG